MHTASSIKTEILKHNKDIGNPVSNKDIVSINKENNHRHANADTAGVYYAEEFKDNRIDHESFHTHFLFFGNSIKHELDHIIWLYQRAISYIPSLSNRWFS